MRWRTLSLKVITPPGTGYVTSAPPPVTVTPDADRYVCGACGTTLLIAATHEVHGLMLRCRECGRYNKVD